MPLTSDQIGLVKASYARISRHVPAYADLFYHRLLHKHPFARAVFPDDLRHQSEVFRQTLDAMVERVDDVAALLPDLTALAQRHVGYGVEAKHYAPVGEVLIDTFAEVLGDRFTPAVRQAWEALYDAISSAMRSEVRTGPNCAGFAGDGG